MSAHDVILQVLLVLDRNSNLVVFVHDVNGKDAVEAVLVNRLPVLSFVLSCTAVCCTALHDCSVHLFHEVPYQRWLEVVRVASLASAYLHSHSSLCFYAQRLVYLHERLRRDFLGKVNFALRLCADTNQHNSD